ncbi:MAG: hypothetical protein V1703_01570 [Candidatus Altiarchaeota archaeon]
MHGRIVSQIGNQLVAEMPSTEVPELGSSVFVNGKKMGVVFDVIGVVEKPYVVVRLSCKASREMVGCDVSLGGRNARQT